VTLIRAETPPDHEAIRRVNQLAFGREEEGRLVDALRREEYSRLSLVAEVEDQVVGHILFSYLPIITENRLLPALALAPMAVAPEHQRRGIGTELVRRGLELCREQGFGIVVVVGHPNYYPRLGFSADLAKPLVSPFAGEAWMAAELTPRALEGVRGRVEYPPPFGIPPD
jgi:putative acetyltransferase